MITPARKRTLHEEISKQIVEQITQGAWTAGQRIPGEQSLSEQFEVSRNSVRESLKALELVGSLRSAPGKGTFVAEDAHDRVRLIRYNTSINTEDHERDLVELMQARLVVEPGLCRLAAGSADEEEIAKIVAIVDESLNAADHNEYRFELGMAFHEQLYHASGNPILINLFAGMKDALLAARREVYFKINTKETLVKELYEHRTIVELIEARKGDEAASAMYAHLLKPLTRLRKIAEAKPPRS